MSNKAGGAENFSDDLLFAKRPAEYIIGVLSFVDGRHTDGCRTLVPSEGCGTQLHVRAVSDPPAPEKTKTHM